MLFSSFYILIGLVTILCQMWQQYLPVVEKILWRKKRQPILAFLPGESDGQRSLVGYSPRSRKESQLKQLSTYICFLSPLKQKFHGDRDFSICLTLKSPGPRTMPDEQQVLQNYFLNGYINDSFLYSYSFLGFPGGVVVNNSPAKQETQVQSLGQEDPLEKEMAVHTSILGKSQRQRSLETCRSWSRKESDMIQQLNNTNSILTGVQYIYVNCLLL